MSGAEVKSGIPVIAGPTPHNFKVGDKVWLGYVSQDYYHQFFSFHICELIRSFSKRAAFKCKINVSFQVTNCLIRVSSFWHLLILILG